MLDKRLLFFLDMLNETRGIYIYICHKFQLIADEPTENTTVVEISKYNNNSFKIQINFTKIFPVPKCTAHTKVSVKIKYIKTMIVGLKTWMSDGKKKVDIDMIDKFF